MNHQTISVADLSLDPSNVRKHSRRNLDAIKASLRKFGQQKPIVVDAKGIVLAGNGTLTAAKELGWTEIQIVRTELAGVEATAFAIADNRTAELAEWDEDGLANVLQSLKVEDADLLAATGYDAAEVDKMSKAEVTEDEVPEPPAEPITKLGDLWILGDHRVLCGDSTKAEDVERLMVMEKAALVFTDPPYGMSFQSNFRTASPQFEKIENDDKILVDWIPHAIEHSNGWVFVWTTWKVLDRWLPVVQLFGKLSNMVVWHKAGGSMGDLSHTFGTDYELALVFSRGAELCGKRIGSVWAFNKDAASTYVHPTQKPIALAAEAIEKTTTAKALVMDLFLGSGTTLIAAEQLGRKCYGMEISPAYCDVIVQRWENLTGKKAVLDKPTT